MSDPKILVVEDEEIVAFDLETTLIDLNYEVVGVVASGEEAIEQTGEMGPDLVLMDIRLKGKMDGIEATEEIRRRYQLPVVYLTANTDVATFQRAKSSAPFGYVMKPFEDKALQTTIEMALARHQAEVKISEALAKEKELSSLRSKFISIASHEFRTPLTVIRGSSELLERYCRPLDEKKNKHFQQIQGSVDQMIRLLDEVLLIGMAEAGKLEFKPAPLDLVDLCRNLVESLEVNADGKQRITLRVEGDCDKVFMDEKLLRHIFTNLISNAIKYSPEGGNVNFELKGDDRTVTFRVQDEGIGIPQKDQTHLFDSFHRGSNVGNIKGTGLGMSIIKKSVDRHGGEITFDSKEGCGTTFTVILPKT